MSDAVEDTPAGATRVLFGTISFVCIMVGIEGVTNEQPHPFLLNAAMFLIGTICAYAAAFWNSAKRILSEEARRSIQSFASHTSTKAALLFAGLMTLALSPFVEQKRWPFSYPADPAVYAEISKLRVGQETLVSDLNALRRSATKYEVLMLLRSSSNGQCSFYEVVGARARQMDKAREELDEILYFTGWKRIENVQGESDFGASEKKINIKVGQTPDGFNNADAHNCAAQLAASLRRLFSDISISTSTEQDTPYLRECKMRCFEIDIGL